MSEQTVTPKSNRTLWLVAGALGCLVICLLVAVAGVAFYFMNQNVASATPTRAPVVVLPTVPPQSTKAPVSSSSASSVVSSVQPTLPPPPPASSAAPTVQPPASSASPQPTVAPAAPRGRLAFTVRRGDRPEDNYIWVMNADGTAAKEILKRASEPAFSPDGTRIAFYQWTDGIFVANADGTNVKKILGETNAGFLSWSNDGRWIAFSVRPGRSGNIVTDAIAPDGTGRRSVTIGWSPSWSPDDALVVFQTCRGAGCGIYKAPSTGGEAVPIITDDGGLAAFSTDGKRILYQKDVDGVKHLFMINADGSGKKQLTSGASLHVSGNWSPDGNFIFYRSPEGGTWGIWRMNTDGSNRVKLANDLPPGDWPYDRIAVTK